MTSNTDKINILTYNFFLRPPAINNNGNDYKEDRLLTFVESQLSNYDIICMQEVFAFGSTRRKRLLDAAEKGGLPYNKTDHLPRFFLGIDGGLIILSRHPIVKSEELVYKHGVHSDAFSNKGALYVKVKVAEDFHIHVFNTHTQASYTTNPTMDDKSVQARLQQILELRNFVDAMTTDKPSGEPVFLCGDFNVNSRISPTEEDNLSSPEYHAMTQILCEGRSNIPQSPTSEVALTSCVYRDLLFEELKHHPITYGDFTTEKDGEIKALETVLTLPGDQCSGQSLDYIFQKEELSENNKTPYQVDVQSIQVEPLYIDPIEKFPCTQLSDHYGVSTQLFLRRQ